MKQAVVALSLLAAVITGCTPPPSYTDARPPVDSLVPGNTDLQAKDVLAATDMMVNNLLSQPDINDPNKNWTIVLDKVQNKTNDPAYNYEAFALRLKSRLAQLGHGRVMLIENKARFHDLQSQELEQSPGVAGGGSPAGVQPQYALYITIDELSNRATTYYGITATLTNLQNRTTPWISPIYEVQTSND